MSRRPLVVALLVVLTGTSCSLWLRMPGKDTGLQDTATDTATDMEGDTGEADVPEDSHTEDTLHDTVVTDHVEMDPQEDPLDVPPDTHEIDMEADTAVSDTHADTVLDPDVAEDTVVTDPAPDTVEDTVVTDPAPDTVEDVITDDAGCAWTPTHVDFTVSSSTDFYYSTDDGSSEYDTSFYGSVCTGFGGASRAEYIVEVQVPAGSSTMSVQSTGLCDLSEDSSMALVTTDGSCAPVVVATRCDECSYEATFTDQPVTGGKLYWIFIETNNMTTPVSGHFFISFS